MRIEAEDQSRFIQLLAQLDQVARRCTDIQYRSRKRYYEAMRRFCVYLADESQISSLEDISAEHLKGYIGQLRARHKTEKTIKMELSAIRFFHDRMPYAKGWLPDNRKLGIDVGNSRSCWFD